MCYYMCHFLASRNLLLLVISRWVPYAGCCCWVDDKLDIHANSATVTSNNILAVQTYKDTTTGATSTHVMHGDLLCNFYIDESNKMPCTLMANQLQCSSMLNHRPALL